MIPRCSGAIPVSRTAQYLLRDLSFALDNADHYGIVVLSQTKGFYDG
jgi:hypothetical protein